MVTPQIVDYIKNTLQQGYPEEKIREALGKKGWAPADVAEAFRIARGVPKSPVTSADSSSPKAPQTPQQRLVTPVSEKPLSSAMQQFPPVKPATVFAPPASLPGASLARPASSAQMPVLRPLGSIQSPPVSPAVTLAVPSSGTASVPVSRPASPALPLQPTYPHIPPQTPPVRSVQPLGTVGVSVAPPSAALGDAIKPIQPSSKPIMPTTPEFLRTSVSPSATQISVSGKLPPIASKETTAPSSPVEAVGKTPEQKKPKKTWLYVVVGVVLIFVVYVFAGVQYGIYAFGYNLFPFEGLVQTVGKKIGLVSPTPLPDQLKIPTPAPTSLPQPTSVQTPAPSASSENPQVNGRTLTLYGTENEAGTLADLAYSADRKKIAYSTLSDTANLWIMDLASGSKENVLRGGQVVFDHNETPALFAWSPDGRILAIVAGNNDIGELYILDISTKHLTKLTTSSMTSSDDEVQNDRSLVPTWNSDGSALLAYIGQDLWKISANGQDRVRITAGLPLGSYAWSHDNAKITYTIRRDSEEKVWIMDADGKNYHTLTPGGVSQLPQFSADDASIYYASRDATGKQDGLWRIGVDGSNPEQVVSINGTIREFVVAMTGERILITSRNANGTNSLWLVYEDNKGIEEVLPAGEYEPMGFAAWGIDGASIFTAGLRQFLIQLSVTKSTP